MQAEVGAALLALRGGGDPHAAARELGKQLRPARALDWGPVRPVRPRRGVRSVKEKVEPEKTKPRKRARRNPKRKMVLPPIRVVSGGLPGLGKRR